MGPKVRRLLKSDTAIALAGALLVMALVLSGRG